MVIDLKPLVDGRLQFGRRKLDAEEIGVFRSQTLTECLALFDGFALGDVVSDEARKLACELVLERLDGALDMRLLGRAIGGGDVDLDIEIVEQLDDGETPHD